jgi:glycosyltransferase involved in cell wall biosynthesis
MAGVTPSNRLRTEGRPRAAKRGPGPGPRRRGVLMLAHSYYEEDPRVRREAEALVRSGMPVDVIALRRPGMPARDSIEGVEVHRLPVQRHQGAGLVRYVAEYGEFFWRAAFVAARLHRRRRFGLAQVHTLPDPLVFAVAPLRALGIPVLLDLHEAMPEFFRSRFPGACNPLVHAGLGTVEWLSVAFADRALTVNDALADRLRGLGFGGDKVSVILNSPSEARFDPNAYPRRPFMSDGTLRLVYAGALTPTYELDVVIGSLELLRDGDPAVPVTLDVYGRGDSAGALRAFAAARGVDDRVAFHGRIPIEEVPARIAAADVGLAPTRRDAFTDFSLSTKLFECAAMGKPVVASRLPTVCRYFGEEALFGYEPGDAASLADALRRVVADPAAREQAVAAASARVDELSWERESARYVALVEELLGGA